MHVNTPPVTAGRFAAFRIFFGLYLLGYLGSIWDEQYRLYSISGWPRFEPFRLSPGINWLRHARTPESVEIFMVLLTAAVVLFTLGAFRRLTNIAVFYGFACMFMMGEYATSVSNAYTGWMLLACLLVPAGELWSLDRLRLKYAGDVASWRFPPLVYWGAWVIFGIAYTSSGLDKLVFVKIWQNGTALQWVLTTPIQRLGPVRDLVAGLLDAGLGKGLTWFVIAFELFAAPLCLSRFGRLAIWLCISVMHVMLIVICEIEVTSFGMLMFQFFIFDERWLRRDYWGATA